MEICQGISEYITQGTRRRIEKENPTTSSTCDRTFSAGRHVYWANILRTDSSRSGRSLSPIYQGKLLDESVSSAGAPAGFWTAMAGWPLRCWNGMVVGGQDD
jgi:hypothetical protein